MPGGPAQSFVHASLLLRPGATYSAKLRSTAGHDLSSAARRRDMGAEAGPPPDGVTSLRPSRAGGRARLTLRQPAPLTPVIAEESYELSQSR